MVLGLKSKSSSKRNGAGVQVDYLIHVKEITPWALLQSLKSQSLILQWQNGDQSNGFLTSSAGDGKLEFNETFRLSVTLCKEVSRKHTAQNGFQKNYLEFHLHEPPKDKPTKSQFLASAVIDIADYGIITDAIKISIPVNFKKSSKSTVQSFLYLSIQPFERDKTSLSKEVSLDRYSDVTNGRNDVESEEEIASFTDDEEEYLSKQSSQIISSAALESGKGSQRLYDKNGSGSGSTSANSGSRRFNGAPSLRVRVGLSNPEVNSSAASVNNPHGAISSPLSTDSISNLPNPFKTKVEFPDNNIQVRTHSNRIDFELSRYNKEDDIKYHRTKESAKVAATTSNSHAGLTEDEKLKQDKGHNQEFLEVNKHLVGERLDGKLPKDAIGNQMKLRSELLAPNRTETGLLSGAIGNQMKLRSDSLAPNRTETGLLGSTRRDKLKHLKSVQSHFHSIDNDESIINSDFLEKPKRRDISKYVNKGGMNYAPSEREERITTTLSANEVKCKSQVEGMPEKDDNKAATSAAEAGLCSVAAEHGSSTNMVHVMGKEKDSGLSQNTKRETGKTKCSFSRDNNELEFNVEMLEEELMEAAALEVGLYSVVAEHGSSTSKVHAPARRLARFYLHAYNTRSQAKQASAARAIISGLIVVSKACGNDVQRLTFWLSNSIVLRAILTQAVEKSEVSSSPSSSGHCVQDDLCLSSPFEEQTDKKVSSYLSEEPQTYIAALEKVEAWIFSRIVESIWWQTLTPHMQSSAVKSSSSRKTSAKSCTLGDQEQGNFAIELWKKAFKDACERLCNVRAGGHECRCLAVLARLVMEQLVDRLDVAMFNAILRESADEMPTDPVSDPISDPKVLPIQAGKSSFGAGAQLKNAIGNWSRWLTDLFGIDDNDSSEEKEELDSNKLECDSSFKAFHLLNALSDLMMLPSEMLSDGTIRKEVCPMFGAPLIKRVLDNFVPDEFNPNPIPKAVLEALDSEEISKEVVSSIPCNANPIIYKPPPATSVTNIVGEMGTKTLENFGSVLFKKSYTSDDELDELDFPMTSIIVDKSKTSPSSTAWNWMQKGISGRKIIRYQLLREVWKDDE